MFANSNNILKDLWHSLADRCKQNVCVCIYQQNVEMCFRYVATHLNTICFWQTMHNTSCLWLTVPSFVALLTIVHSQRHAPQTPYFVNVLKVVATAILNLCFYVCCSCVWDFSKLLLTYIDMCSTTATISNNAIRIQYKH